MSSFCAVNDEVLVGLIKQAKLRIVYLAPGLHMPVATSLCKRFKEIETLNVTVVLDADEDVCRIGYGELEALREVHQESRSPGFRVRSQPGLRVGVLLVDDQTLIWSPTPRSVEGTPSSESAQVARPNGVFLGGDPSDEIAHSVWVEGEETDPASPKIGSQAITHEQVAAVISALEQNPPIPVDLACVTRVFSTKLQFVELKVTHCKQSQQRLRIASHLLNVDADEDLQALLENSLRVFGDYRDFKVEVPAFVNGVAAYQKDQEQILEQVSEGDLERERKAIERDYFFDVAGFGRLMERKSRQNFEKRIAAYKVRLEAHVKGIRDDMSGKDWISAAVELIKERARTPQGRARTLDIDGLKGLLDKKIADIHTKPPTVTWVFKDVTYEQTQSEDFRRKLMNALPAAVKGQMGPWFEQFAAARHAKSPNTP